VQSSAVTSDELKMTSSVARERHELPRQACEQVGEFAPRAGGELRMGRVGW
jgi:hypothetical protein